MNDFSKDNPPWSEQNPLQKFQAWNTLRNSAFTQKNRQLQVFFVVNKENIAAISMGLSTPEEKATFTAQCFISQKHWDTLSVHKQNILLQELFIIQIKASKKAADESGQLVLDFTQDYLVKLRRVKLPKLKVNLQQSPL